jgi:hypothetical protein
VRLAGDERHDGSTLLVHSEGFRDRAEADTLEVRQERVNRWRPRTRAAVNGVSDPHARAEVASEQRLFHAVILPG